MHSPTGKPKRCMRLRPAVDEICEPPCPDAWKCKVMTFADVLEPLVGNRPTRLRSPTGYHIALPPRRRWLSPTQAVASGGRCGTAWVLAPRARSRKPWQDRAAGVLRLNSMPATRAETRRHSGRSPCQNVCLIVVVLRFVSSPPGEVALQPVWHAMCFSSWQLNLTWKSRWESPRPGAAEYCEHLLLITNC